MRPLNRLIALSTTPALAAFLLICSAPQSAAAPAAATPAGPTAAAPAKSAIRIKAGAFAAQTDADGNAWLPDQGFDGGDTVDRGSIEIAGTKSPALYRSEHYSMSAFSCKVPNGKYVVKLHFAETFEEITGPGQRVFSLNVEGHEIKDLDVYAKAGGALRAHVETVNVDVADGKLDITFSSKIENPEINAIEIIPAS